MTVYRNATVTIARSGTSALNRSRHREKASISMKSSTVAVPRMTWLHRCAACVSLGLTSMVYPANYEYVALHFHPYYGTDGAYHCDAYWDGDEWRAGSNEGTGYYICSRGHTWHEQ